MHSLFDPNEIWNNLASKTYRSFVASSKPVRSMDRMVPSMCICLGKLSVPGRKAQFLWAPFSQLITLICCCTCIDMLLQLKPMHVWGLGACYVAFGPLHRFENERNIQYREKCGFVEVRSCCFEATRELWNAWGHGKLGFRNCVICRYV